ncbi:hypothetical protein ABK040_011741 [Willaertia magna]
MAHKLSDLVVAGRAISFKGLNSAVLDEDAQEFNFVPVTIPFEVNKIISGGAYEYEYNCFWTKDNKIYLSLPLPVTNYITIFDDKEHHFKAYEIDYKKYITDLNKKEKNLNLEIKEIIGNANGLLFWMKNGHLYNFVFNRGCKQIKVEKKFKVISAIGTGTLTERFYFVEEETSNCYVNEGFGEESTVVFDAFSMTSTPSLMGCCFSGSLDVIITKDNNLYYKVANEQFTHKPTKFTSSVKQLKCGYKHAALLLSNNEVFYFDTSFIKHKGNLKSPEFIKELFKVDITTLSSPVITEIYCGSLKTAIVTKEELVLLEEPHLQRNTRLERKKFKEFVKLSLPNCCGIDLLIDYHVAVGPWHQIIYAKRSTSKTLEYLSTNLIESILYNVFSDIDFL